MKKVTLLAKARHDKIMEFLKDKTFWAALAGINLVSGAVCLVVGSPASAVFSGVGFVSCLFLLYSGVLDN